MPVLPSASAGLRRQKAAAAPAGKEAGQLPEEPEDREVGEEVEDKEPGQSPQDKGLAGWPRPLPEATVRRLPLYLQVLAETADERQATISSEGLASRAGVNAAQVRKDLSYMGSYGTRGVGYDVELLAHRINQQLGLDEVHNVALVGVGHLGQALGNYRGFDERGFHIVAAFDADPGKVGGRLGEVLVEPVSRMEEVVRMRHVTMAIIATPASVAQKITDRLVAAGVTSVLNFAPVLLNVGPHVSLRKVDLAVELQILGYYQHLHASTTSS
ncbi:MAG: redox-sensing transcriptional repressor Rex [Acidimicrobiales bacterium]